MNDHMVFLTPRRREVLEFIVATEASTGLPPTFDEIRHELGVNAFSTVHEHLRWLVDAGLLECSYPFAVRGYRATEAGVRHCQPTPIQRAAREVLDAAVIEAIRDSSGNDREALVRSAQLLGVRGWRKAVAA